MSTSSDTDNPRLYIEAKTRKKMPFSKLWKDTIKKAHKENKIPVIILHETHMPMDSSMVMIEVGRYAKLEYLVDLTNKAIGNPELWDDVCKVAEELVKIDC